MIGSAFARLRASGGRAGAEPEPQVLLELSHRRAAVLRLEPGELAMAGGSRSPSHSSAKRLERCAPTSSRMRASQHVEMVEATARRELAVLARRRVRVLHLTGEACSRSRWCAPTSPERTSSVTIASIGAAPARASSVTKAVLTWVRGGRAPARRRDPGWRPLAVISDGALRRSPLIARAIASGCACERRGDVAVNAPAR